MSIASETNRNNYLGNGAVSNYSFTFKVFTEDDLLVTVKSDLDVESTLTKTTHYTVTGAGLSAGGSITLVNGAFDWITSGSLKNNYTLSIRRYVDVIQETDIRNQGEFYPEVHEDAFDYLTMIDLQQQDEINRSVKLSETALVADFDPTLPVGLIGEVNKVLMTNATGDGFEVGPSAASVSNAQGYATAAAASAAAALVSENAAAASASAASTSASNAATSASNAATSESNINSAISTHNSDTTSVHGITDTSLLVTTNGVQAITNKDIDGGTASNTNRITLPKDTLTNLTALTRKEGTLVYASDTDKPYFDDGTNLKVIGSGSGGSVNFITDGDAEAANIWTAYALTEAVTFTDAGDLVTLNSHNLQNGAIVSFSVITSTTGISINTAYYVVGATTNTFQVASTLGGSALALTTNGSGTLLRSRPVTATGGSPNVTATISSSTPLIGSNSFVFTKDAANRQGQGIATTFSVDLGYRAKVMQIEFDYIVGSGTFTAGSSSADSDLIVYIYDVTNSALIEPSSIKLLSNSSTIGDKFVANFQTSATGASYRLILHCATTSASAYTVKLDSVRVGPCSYVYGTVVTNPIAYTPTITGFGSVTAVNFKSWRVGKHLHVDGTFTTGTPTAVEGQITLGYGGGNANVTSASTLPALSLAGTGHRDASGAEDHTILIEPSKTYFTTGIQTSVVAGLAKANGSAIIGTGQKLSFNARVEIEGWDSNNQVSDGYDARQISAYYNGQPTGTLSGADNNITFPTKVIDDVNAMSGATYTIPSSGKYKVNVQVALTTTSATSNQYFTLSIKQSGTLKAENAIRAEATSVDNRSVTLHNVILNCIAGETITVTSNTNMTGVSYNSTATRSYFSIEKMASPQTVSMTSRMSAKYYGSSTSLSTTTTPAKITYTTKDHDDYGSYSSGIYTIAESGVYQVSAAIQYVYSSASGVSVSLNIFKNGSAVKEKQLNQTGITNGDATVEVYDQFAAIYGDQIEIRGHCNGTSPSINASNARNTFTLLKIK